MDYWKQRLRDDTAIEMNLMKECHAEAVITVSRRSIWNNLSVPAPPQDSENASLYMDELWNWCSLEGCRQIIKSGRLFMKTKMRARYRYDL